MNIRKNIDYTDMYVALDSAMEKGFSQVELYYEIGKAVCQRTEKGAAVAAAGYLSGKYPDVQGFSPRNLRRMRDFYRTYEGHSSLLAAAMQIGWTQNVVIMEADLTIEAREWYLKAVKQSEWSKAELVEMIASDAHEVIALRAHEKECKIAGRRTVFHRDQIEGFCCEVNKRWSVSQKAKSRMESKKEFKRRWFTRMCPLFTKKQNLSYQF